jgi:plastocyanin
VFVPPAADGHPGHGPATVYAEDSPQRFTPGGVTVGVGEPVLWAWRGAVRNHSVTADAGQAERFDSDPGEPPGQVTHSETETFVHVFRNEGTFTYYCKVHPSMRGEVKVVHLTPSDLTRPRLGGVRVGPRSVCSHRSARCRKARARVRFELSERADVLARILRRGRTVRAFDFAGNAGRNLKRLRTRGLPLGPYRLQLTAFDAADNSSDSVFARFAVRAP